MRTVGLVIKNTPKKDTSKKETPKKETSKNDVPKKDN